jgi:flagellar M-ring protein FliF
VDVPREVDAMDRKSALGRFAAVLFALGPRQRIIALLAAAATLAAVWGLVEATRTPSMATLYAGLEPQAAAEVAAAVQGMGVAVETQGATILVPEPERDRVRLALAAQGLPRNGPAGYELLEQIDGFGATSEMFEAAYWRAKEGELARTILAAPGVRSARVHIANPVGRPFRRGSGPSASATVVMAYGALGVEHAEAIRYLIASAIAGLAPDRVSVIDAAHGAVLRMGETEAEGSGAGGRPPGASREAALRAEVERLLAARVGEGRAIVTVSVDTNTETETVVERVLDPQGRVAISSDSREVSENESGGAQGGAATVASNLPVPGPAAGGDQRSARTESEERVNYEVSETTRERVRRGGDVRRVTVAVLVDGVSTVAADGARTWAPRPAEELTQLRDLVRAAVGYDERRGDIVTVETLEFAERAAAGVTAEAGGFDFLSRHGMALFQTGALAAVALGLGLFVLRPILQAGAVAARTAAERRPPPLDYHGAEDLPPPEPADRLTLLRAAFSEQREESANVLRSWLERDVQETGDSETRAT